MPRVVADRHSCNGFRGRGSPLRLRGEPVGWSIAARGFIVARWDHHGTSANLRSWQRDRFCRRSIALTPTMVLTHRAAVMPPTDPLAIPEAFAWRGDLLKPFFPDPVDA